ncbi:MAG: Unknown protein [uncultured Thiotrichaceae bacterium]|uniref:Glycosyl transferase family 1 domain-containing protein n=1 Tax=uncultured Thiotrichaceae bacterium TaxID=298394 RepID=A0A6S6TDM2_9GAMM|nr:MAG: Unknown protein [uncultured Thiotrichaceae bacterium]
MKKIAFYAPLKAPDHPVPSGDRLIAQLLMKALQTAGFEVKLASRFRTRDGKGDSDWQQRAIHVGRKIARRLILSWEQQDYRPDAWFTYHLYYKAPDLIGPYIAEHFRIPYLVAEASWAGKRANGPWHLYHQQLEQALLQANRIFTINPVDSRALPRFIPDVSRIITLRPFLDFSAIQDTPAPPQPTSTHTALDTHTPQLITVAMMRAGDKLASYQLLSEALAYVTQPFQWFIVGDGPERSTVEGLFANDPRIHFCGQLNNQQVHALLTQCHLHVWPAVNEAFGMALLEAQYQGVAILSGDEGGVSHVMKHGVTGELVPARDAQALGLAIQRLLTDAGQLQHYRQHAQHYVETNHSLTQAANVLKHEISALLKEFSHA